MGSVTQTLWLPVGRANFFSATSDVDLLAPAGKACKSTEIDDPDYIPHLSTTVMRRLLEVLPRSFGYAPVGFCEMTDGVDTAARPTSVSIRLQPSALSAPLVPHAVEANELLVKAGVSVVHLWVSEHGAYAFHAEFDGESAAASEALLAHLLAVFGGKFTVERLEPKWPKDFNEGAAAVSRYNGLGNNVLVKKGDDPESQPLGILTFFQLNILVEGLCNQTLLPSVFFERYGFTKNWLKEHQDHTSVLTTLGQVIKALIDEGDGTREQLQSKAIRRFLLVSRGSLQRMKRSVGSVRRQMLEALMAVLHRQSPMIQLDLGAVDYEASPELTGPNPTESQMRGYVMLIAVKITLIHNISDAAEQAVAQLERAAARRGVDLEADSSAATLMRDLKVDLDQWRALLTSVNTDISGLEGAVGHDWQERLLYELEQQRSEQEAIAEIERGRRGRIERKPPIDSVYAGVNLLLTGLGVVVAVRNLGNQPLNSFTPAELAIRLLPVLVIAVMVALSAPLIHFVRRSAADGEPRSEAYGFEFAFRIQEETSPAVVAAYLTEPQKDVAVLQGFPEMRVRRLGGWRIEQPTPDRTLMKAHSIVAVKIAKGHYARFETVTEVVARKVAEGEKYTVRQCRMFGESSQALRVDQVHALVRGILKYVCEPLVVDKDGLPLERIMEPIKRLCGVPDEQATEGVPRQPQSPEQNQKLVAVD